MGEARRYRRRRSKSAPLLLAGPVIAAFFVCCAALAQPDMFTLEFEPPVIPDLSTELVLPGEDDPIPQASPQDIELTLRVERRGRAEKKTGLFSTGGQDYWQTEELTNWSHGPYRMTARLYAQGKAAQTQGRSAIIAYLERWQTHREHYLKVLDSHRRVQTYDGVKPLRAVYYGKISGEVRRIMEAAKNAKRDIDFLASLLKRQRSYQTGTEPLGPIDPRAPVTADIRFAGAKATVKRTTARIYFGKFDGQNTSTENRQIAPNTFQLTPGEPDFGQLFDPNNPAPYSFIPNISVDVLDLAGCETDQLDIILMGFEKRLQALTPAPAEQFDFTAQELDWYSKTTSALMTRIFRETYRQAVYEAVRHAWALSGAAMPREMQLGRASADQELLNWHQGYQDPVDTDYYVDGGGVPLVRQGAPLRLPAQIDGRQMRIYIAETGGTAPTFIGQITSYPGFTHRSISRTTSPGVTHRMMTWSRANAQDGVYGGGGRRISSADIDTIEPYWRRSYTKEMRSDFYTYDPVWNNLRTTRIFQRAPVAIDPAEDSSTFSSAPRMHVLQARNWEGPLRAQINVRYERNVPTPGTYDIDQGHQDVTIDLSLKPVSSAAPLQICPEPQFEEPPALRVVQLWENEADTTADDDYRPISDIWPGHPYFVEARFAEAPPDDIYRVRIDGGGSFRVTRSKSDSKLFRSEVISFAPEQIQ